MPLLAAAPRERGPSDIIKCPPDTSDCIFLCKPGLHERFCFERSFKAENNLRDDLFSSKCGGSGEFTKSDGEVLASVQKEIPSVRVMIQLQEDAAMELHQGEPGTGPSSTGESKSAEVLNAAAELGVRLAPVNPGQVHPLLAPYFMVEVPNRETAEKVIDRLSRFDVVEAAYIKPDEQAP